MANPFVISHEDQVELVRDAPRRMEAAFRDLMDKRRLFSPIPDAEAVDAAADATAKGT